MRECEILVRAEGFFGDEERLWYPVPGTVPTAGCVWGVATEEGGKPGFRCWLVKASCVCVCGGAHTHEEKSGPGYALRTGEH